MSLGQLSQRNVWGNVARLSGLGFAIDGGSAGVGCEEGGDDKAVSGDGVDGGSGVPSMVGQV